MPVHPITWVGVSNILAGVWGQRIWSGIPDTTMLPKKKKITYLMLFFFICLRCQGKAV